MTARFEHFYRDDLQNYGTFLSTILLCYFEIYKEILVDTEHEGDSVLRSNGIFYVLLTVHLGTIRANLLDALFFNVLISLLYMFRRTQCS